MAQRANRVPGGGFVGRAPERAELRDAWQVARAGRGGVVLLVGEPGIGKTRLADELAGEAVGDGAVVVWGRCWEGGGAPAFWPWIQALRELGERVDLHAAVADAGVDPAALGPVVPSMAGTVFAQSRDTGAEHTAHARFALFDAVARLLGAAAADRPCVVLLDDLHAADEPALLLASYVARDLAGAPLLVVGTYRDLEARRDPAVSALLGDLGASRHGAAVGRPRRG